MSQISPELCSYSNHADFLRNGVFQPAGIPQDWALHTTNVALASWPLVNPPPKLDMVTMLSCGQLALRMAHTHQHPNIDIIQYNEALAKHEKMVSHQLWTCHLAAAKDNHALCPVIEPYLGPGLSVHSCIIALDLVVDQSHIRACWSHPTLSPCAQWSNHTMAYTEHSIKAYIITLHPAVNQSQTRAGPSNPTSGPVIKSYIAPYARLLNHAHARAHPSNPTSPPWAWLLNHIHAWAHPSNPTLPP
ncbi:hypothetical protein BDR03DRAFT_987170 [Suillus americanus]|nr:hypothetical protein BDR03DRAFT_987170 [Suillus americanus]